MSRPQDPTARQRILDAASDLFYERGIHVVGMAEIVEAAGTGKNVLYRHFPGKDELALAYLREFADRIDCEIEEAIADLPPDRALVAVAEHVTSRVSRRSYRGCPFRNYLRETRDTQSRPGRFAIAQVRKLRQRIEALADELDIASPQLVADHVWLVLEGAYAAAPYRERALLAAAALRAVEDLVMKSDGRAP